MSRYVEIATRALQGTDSAEKAKYAKEAPADSGVGTLNSLNSLNSQCATPLSATDRRLIEAWLDYIEEHDPAMRDEVLRMCATNEKHRSYYLARAAEIAPQTEAPARWGELRPCSWCAELNRRTGVCEAARRGLHATRGYTPQPDIPRRCEHYEPRLKVIQECKR